MMELVSNSSRIRTPGSAQLTRLMPTPERIFVPQETSSANAAKSAALAAVLPFQHKTRYANGYTNSPTATSCPWTVSTVDFSAVPAVGAELSGGNHFCAISRDPLNAIIEYVGNHLGLPMNYLASFPTTTGVANPVTIQDRLYLSPVINVPHQVNPCVFNDTAIGNPAYIHPHGSVMYPKIPRTSALFKFTYMTAGETMAFGFFTAGDVLVAVTGGISVYRWTGNTIADATIVALAGATVANFTPTDSGNYAFAVEFSVLSATFSHLRMRLACGGTIPFFGPVPAGPVSHLGHRPMPGIENRTTLTHIRVNGAAIMCTPDSAELAKGGRITGCQVDSAYIVESFVTNAQGGSAVDTIINLEGSDTRDFKKGGYAFHKPYSSDSYTMQQPFRFNINYNPQNIQGVTSTVQAVSDYTSYMEPPDGWVVYAIATPPSVIGGVTSWPGGLCHISHYYSVEFRTNDVWIGKSLPPFGSQMLAYDEMMSYVGTAVQFHDNPFHIRDLLKWYNAASPVASAIAGPAMAILSKLGPRGKMLASVIQTAKDILPSQV